MGVDVVIGGQGGDEGKGKISSYLSLKNNYDICMRVSAPQAGHSVYFNGGRLGIALLPCGFVNKKSRLLLGSGALISLEKLLNEINFLKISEERLGIDGKATIVTENHVKEELSNSHLMSTIGSVGKGISSCRRDKIMRKEDLVFAKDVEELSNYITNTKKEVYSVLEKKGNVLLESDHGAKLDLIHGEYPYVTSKSTNASSVLGEAGIGPREVRDVYAVFKPYVTRVGPGPLEEEIFDEEALHWAHNLGGERGTVSKRKRRLGKFEWDKALEVIKMNSATKLAFSHMDCFKHIGNYLGYNKSKDFLADVEKKLCSRYPYPKISLLSYGPRTKTTTEYKKEFLNKK